VHLVGFHYRNISDILQTNPAFAGLTCVLEYRLVNYTFGENISEFYQLDLGVCMITMQTL